jgi:hypothetical protein
MSVSLRPGKPAQSVTLGRKANSDYKLCLSATSVSLINQSVDFGNGMTTAAPVPNLESSYVRVVGACATSVQSRWMHAVALENRFLLAPSSNDPFNY